MHYVFALDFADKPNYKKLHFMLIKALLELKITPDHQYDWIQNSEESDIE